MSDAEIEATFAAAEESGRKLYEEKVARQKQSEQALREFVRKVYELPAMTEAIEKASSEDNRTAMVSVDDLGSWEYYHEFEKIEHDTKVTFGKFVVQAWTHEDSRLYIRFR
jgi:hypothetical protein